MQCKCGGVLIDGKSTFRTSRKKFSFILQNIPAGKCMRCDEVVFSEETRDKLEVLAERIERSVNEILKTGQGGATTSFRKSTKDFTLIIENVPAARGTSYDDEEASPESVEKIKKLLNRIERDSSEIITGRPSSNLYDY